MKNSKFLSAPLNLKDRYNVKDDCEGSYSPTVLVLEAKAPVKEVKPVAGKRLELLS